jgi:hypothetical protein
MFKVNKSHLNQTVLNNIVKACREAQKQGFQSYVKNKKGNNFLRVNYIKGYILNGKFLKGGFQITDSSGTNIASHLVKLPYEGKNIVKCFIKSKMMFNYQVASQSKHSV